MNERERKIEREEREWMSDSGKEHKKRVGVVGVIL